MTQEELLLSFWKLFILAEKKPSLPSNKEEQQNKEKE